MSPTTTVAQIKTLQLPTSRRQSVVKVHILNDTGKLSLQARQTPPKHPWSNPFFTARLLSRSTSAAPRSRLLHRPGHRVPAAQVTGSPSAQVSGSATSGVYLGWAAGGAVPDQPFAARGATLTDSSDGSARRPCNHILHTLGQRPTHVHQTITRSDPASPDRPRPTRTNPDQPRPTRTS